MNNNTIQFITEKPSFRDMVSMQKHLEDCLEMLNGLAECRDTIQRATDMYISMSEAWEHAKAMLTKEV